MGLEARSNNLLIHNIGAETVVYDRDRQTAHRLNETATAVWQRLNGQTSAEEIATDLRCDSNVVIMAIDHLQSAHLLEGKDPTLVNRRSAVRKVARLAAAGAVLPVVSSIAAPMPAMAHSGEQCFSESFTSGTSGWNLLWGGPSSGTSGSSGTGETC